MYSVHRKEVFAIPGALALAARLCAPAAVVVPVMTAGEAGRAHLTLVVRTATPRAPPGINNAEHTGF